MDEDIQHRFLTGLAEAGDRWVTPLFGYERLSSDWSLDFPNGLPEQLVYLFASGSAHGTADGRPVNLRPGSLLWLPPRTPFRLQTSGRTAIRLYRFRLSADLADGEVCLVPNAWALRETMDSLIVELRGDLTFRAARVRALLVVLFSDVFGLMGRTAEFSPLPERTCSKLEEFADRRIGDRPEVAELAEVAGLSQDYFARRFRRTFGMSPRQWLVRRRIHHAMVRLEESDDTIGAVAGQLGYPDPFSFSRQFKAIAGTSPMAWRRRRGADPPHPGQS